MKWMIQRAKLDSDQEELITRHIRGGNGNVWIKGHAGSGKSVLLVHGLRDKLVENKQLKVGVVLFTRALVDLIRTGLDELGIEKEFSVRVPVMTYYDLQKTSQEFDLLFCDEVQDLPPSMIMLLRNKAKRVIVAGDSQQSIYSHDPQTHEAVVQPDQIGNLLGGQAHELPTIYRLTRSIIKLVSSLVGGTILGARRDATKADVQVRLGYTNDKSREVKYVWRESSKRAQASESTVILLPSRDSIAVFCNDILKLNGKPEWVVVPDRWGKNQDFAAMNRHLEAQGIKLEYIGNGVGTLDGAYNNHRVAVMTYHSSKGLDYENVYLPWVSAGLHLNGSGKDKTLFMVAMTRSRKNLVLTYCGTRSIMVDALVGDCILFEITDTSTAPAQPQAATYDF
jgi:superfamily I DNA/RNA helicase